MERIQLHLDPATLERRGSSPVAELPLGRLVRDEGWVEGTLAKVLVSTPKRPVLVDYSCVASPEERGRRCQDHLLYGTHRRRQLFSNFKQASSRFILRSFRPKVEP